MGQNAKIRTLRKAMREQIQKHEKFATLSPTQQERWLSMAVRDAMIVADERSRLVNAARQMKKRIKV
jgi:hypothetical protein